jgi:type VI secretion system protein ImpH
MPDALSTLRQLEEAARRFDFFQAVRLLECAYPERPRVGESLRARDDFVRFVQEPELIFYPTTLGGFELGKNGKPPRLTVNFIGLLGPNGPLPTHLTEYVRDRARNAGDPTFARFLDVFHHRMVALFYRAWAQAQPAVSLDRPGRDRFSAYVGSVFGLAEPSLRERDAVPDFAKLHFAGLLGGPTRPAAGLRLVLSRFFGLPVEIEECVGHWIALPANSVSRLGAPDGSCVLGMTTLVGARVWDCQHKFRIVIGPLSMADYERFLPGGASLVRLVDWVRNYVRDGLDWDVNLCLKQKEVPRLRLGRHARLGLTSWLYSGQAAHDARDLLLVPADPSGRART